MDATLPTTIEAKGEHFNPEVTPVERESHFQFPANDWRGQIHTSWYQRGVLPRSPSHAIDLKAIDHGVWVKGSKGFLVADFTSRMIIPFGSDADFSCFQPAARSSKNSHSATSSNNGSTPAKTPRSTPPAISNTAAT